MAITKTDFIEFSRCPRYVFLENLKASALKKDMSYEEYKEKEEKNNLKELLEAMLDTSEDIFVDKTEKINQQLMAMLPYYKQVELEAGRIFTEYFKGESHYALNTQDQKEFHFDSEKAKYLCYVDIYNENKEEINIVEVKATTARKYISLEAGYPKKEKYSIFTKKDNVYYLKGEIDYFLEEEMPKEKYLKERTKLFERFKLGKYFYDLAFQRYIIERCSLKKPVHYYLAVLNPYYVFDGTLKDGKPYYHKIKEEELITFISGDEITKEYQEKIKEDMLALEERLNIKEDPLCPLGNYCGYKEQGECKYFKTVCGLKIPKKNSSLNYVNNGFGFLVDKKRIKGLELINEGYLKMEDIPKEWLKSTNHLLQRECLENHKSYVNKEKISKALASLEYPIYHLDFETFPCPLPRFKGEFPYIQSPFEFSLHIEVAPGECDLEKDNIVFLAQTMNDERENLIKALLKYVNPDKGTLFAQNVSFEKGRIRELAFMFPKYKEPLLKIYNRGFDLLWLVNNNKELYQKLGFKDKDLETFNFYDERLSGSFSIKKTLPVFSSLSYDSLEVHNGTEAIVVYANYQNFSKEELLKQQEALRIYCRQDTWAMVEILNALRHLVK